MNVLTVVLDIVVYTSVLFINSAAVVTVLNSFLNNTGVSIADFISVVFIYVVANVVTNVACLMHQHFRVRRSTKFGLQLS